MLNRRDVSIGKCYVKDRTRIAREVIAVVHRRKVVYNAYDLRTGKLLRTQHEICPKNQMIRWADREARPHEIAKLRRDEATEIFQNIEGEAKINDAGNKGMTNIQ